MAWFCRVERVRTALAIAAALTLAFSSAGVFAQSAGTGVETSAGEDPPDYPIPSKAGEAYSPIQEGFETPIDPRGDLKAAAPYVDERAQRLKAARGGQRPFFRDTELKANSRSYWLDLKKLDGTDAEALTTGGYLSYQSGYAGDLLQLRAVLYTTQPLYAPPGAGATLNLTPDGDQITTLGQANARLKLLGQELSAGRQLIRTAFMNPNDNRMIPITFEGLFLVPERRKDLALDYVASYLWRYKPRDSEEFISFSTPFGITEDEGVLINGVRHHSRSLNLGAVNYWIKDTLNTAYGEADYLLPFGGGARPKLPRQHQRPRPEERRQRSHLGRAVQHLSGVYAAGEQLSGVCVDHRALHGRHRRQHPRSLRQSSRLHLIASGLVRARRRGGLSHRAVLRLRAAWHRRVEAARRMGPGRRCHQSANQGGAARIATSSISVSITSLTAARWRACGCSSIIRTRSSSARRSRATTRRCFAPRSITSCR